MSVRLLSLAVAILSVLTSPLRAAEPAKLEIVKATWSVDGKTWADVTQNVAALVKNDRLDMKVDPVLFGGDPVPPRRVGQLKVVYRLGGPEKTVNFRAGDEVWIAAGEKDLVRAAERLPELRKKYPTRRGSSSSAQPTASTAATKTWPTCSSHSCATTP
jgi:hypothetical protein